MRKYINLILVLFVFSSCEDVIEVDVKNQEKDLYIVEAKITTLNEPWVFVTKTLSVTVDQPYSGISNLAVSITDNAQPANVITLTEDSERNGYYTVPEDSTYFGIPGRTYTVTILTPESVTLTATETLYPVEPIDSIQVKPSDRGDNMFLGIFTFGKETQGLGNFYKWDIYVNDTLLNINHADYLVYASDEQVDGNYILGLEVFTDYYDPNIEEERLLKLYDTIYVEQTSTTEFAYYYYFQMSNQASAGSMFSVPPANIPSNFTASDGQKVVGLFTAHDISISNTIIIDETIEALLKKL
jgi:hypothetical protein